VEGRGGRRRGDVCQRLSPQPVLTPACRKRSGESGVCSRLAGCGLMGCARCHILAATGRACGAWKPSKASGRCARRPRAVLAWHVSSSTLEGTSHARRATKTAARRIIRLRDILGSDTPSCVAFSGARGRLAARGWDRAVLYGGGLYNGKCGDATPLALFPDRERRGGKTAWP
jgi:hypothetical protein